MTDIAKVIAEIRSEADISARPGQCERLNAIADRIAALPEASRPPVVYLTVRGKKMKVSALGAASDLPDGEYNLYAAPVADAPAELIADMQSFADRLKNHSQDGTIHPELYEADHATLMQAIRYLKGRRP